MQHYRTQPAIVRHRIDTIANAITRAKSADPEAVRKALVETQAFAGVTGALSYASGSLVPRKAVTVIEVGRRAELAAQITPDFVAKP